MSEKARLQSGERRTPEFFQQESQNTKVDQIQEHPRTKVQNVIVQAFSFTIMFFTGCFGHSLLFFLAILDIYRWVSTPPNTPPTPGERTATRTEHDFRQDLAGTSNLAGHFQWKLIRMMELHSGKLT